ncbi:hypothetical protein [Pedobacter gandavensis]|nr:hypothetical protein [Pedobacter gandavensis]
MANNSLQAKQAAQLQVMTDNFIAQQQDATNKGNHTVAQRVIDFSKKSSTVPVSNIDELIDFFVAKYGRSNEEVIREKIGKINEDKEVWSVFDVYRLFKDEKLPVYTEVEFSHHSSRPTLPGGSLSDKGRYAAINQFSFNTVTRLVGLVGKKRFETRNDSNDDLHAEQIFMRQVESSGIPLNAHTVIQITINNSPCHEKCATLLANWVKNHKLKKVTIFFANPYGTDEEFTNAIGILKEAGIMIHGFVPLDEVGPDTDEEIDDDYRVRFTNMRDRLKSAKGKKLYTSDDESSSSDDDSIYAEEEEEEGLTFKEWMKAIEILAWTEYGLKLEDLPDEMFMVAYEDGDSPLEFYNQRMSKGKSAGPYAPTYNIGGEGELEPVMISSVAEFLNDRGVHPGSSIFVVSGKNWECYIRCVLHHFGKIGLLGTVVEALRNKGIDISNGVAINTIQEDGIREILAAYVGAFHVTATDYNQNIMESSRTTVGTKVRIILTGAHFSLLK